MAGDSDTFDPHYEMLPTPEGFVECLTYQLLVDNKQYVVKIVDRSRISFSEEPWQK